MIKQRFYKKLGVNLRYARLARRMTQQELADRVDTTRQAIANIEAGLPSRFYIEVIWALGLDAQLLTATSAEKDVVGRSLAYGSLPKRATKPRTTGDSNEFDN